MKVILMHPSDLERAVAGGMTRWTADDVYRDWMDVVRVADDPYCPMEEGEIAILNFPARSQPRLVMLGPNDRVVRQ